MHTLIATTNARYHEQSLSEQLSIERKHHKTEGNLTKRRLGTKQVVYRGASNVAKCAYILF